MKKVNKLNYDKEFNNDSKKVNILISNIINEAYDIFVFDINNDKNEELLKKYDSIINSIIKNLDIIKKDIKIKKEKQKIKELVELEVVLELLQSKLDINIEENKEKQLILDELIKNIQYI